MSARMFGRLSAIAMVAVAAAGVACNSDRANVLDPIGAPSWDVKLLNKGVNLPRGTIKVVAGGANSLTVDMQGLQALTSGVYRLWLADSAMTTFTPARGVLTEYELDTTFSAQGDPIIDTAITVLDSGATSFNVGGPRQRLHLVVDQVSLSGDPLAAGPVFLVTAEASAASATPAADASRPLGVLHSVTAAQTKSLSFGYFSTDPAQSYVYLSAGFGTAGVRDNVIIVDDSTTMRPPPGYYLASFLLWSDSTGSDTIPLGAQTAPYPRRNVSLYNADVDATIDPTVLAIPPRIIAAANRANADTLAKLTSHNAGATGLAKDFRGVSAVQIVLMNKMADPLSMAPTLILRGDMPAQITKGP